VAAGNAAELGARGRGPSQIEPLVSAALDLLAIDRAQAGALTRALEVKGDSATLATADEWSKPHATEVLGLMPSGTLWDRDFFHSVAVGTRQGGKLLDKIIPRSRGFARVG